MTPKARGPSLRLYRRIAVSFLVIVLFVLFAVVYLSIMRATIRVKTTAETIKTDFLLDVVKIPTRPTEVRGRVASRVLEKTETAKPGGDGTTMVDAIAHGKVTIHNTSGSEQELVVRTRLLSPEGVLFRIDETILIPARGEKTVDAHADKPGDSGNIGPIKVTISGLAVARQEFVYADSVESFTGGVVATKAIGESDIDSAFAKLKADLETDAKVMLRESVGTMYTGETFQVQVSDQESSVKVGASADEFTVRMKARVTGVFFDRNTAEEVAATRLYNELGSGRRFVEMNMEGLQLVADKVDVMNETASLRVYLDGRTVASTTSAKLNPSRFAGMTAEDVKKALVLDDGVASDVIVEFFPFWVKRVPRLTDHIFVEIE